MAAGKECLGFKGQQFYEGSVPNLEMRYILNVITLNMPSKIYLLVLPVWRSPAASPWAVCIDPRPCPRTQCIGRGGKCLRRVRSSIWECIQLLTCLAIKNSLILLYDCPLLLPAPVDLCLGLLVSVQDSLFLPTDDAVEGGLTLTVLPLSEAKKIIIQW